MDGNNWYHSLKKSGIGNLGQLNYAKVSKKLMDGRIWMATRYYIGQVQQTGNSQLYADQRSYMAWLHARDPRITVHYGRLEQHTMKNEMALEIKHFLSNLTVKIDPNIYRSLHQIAAKHLNLLITKEKAVDVMIAVDMVLMAERDEYDVAYLLSADGDYTPAAKAVIQKGKKVFAVSTSHGAELARAVSKFIHLGKEWLDDCFGI